MAELTANDIGRLLAPTNEGVRLLTVEQEQTTADIKSMHETLSNIGVTINKIFTDLGRVSRQIDKPPVIENNVQADVEEKQTEKRIKPLETISKHLLDIKEFLKDTFTPQGPPTSLTQSTEDDSTPLEKLEEKNKDIEKQNSDVVSASQSALGWLGSLFTIGALPAIAGVLGLGAAGGVGGGVLSKLLPKIFNFAKPVLRRIPIIGTLISWHEAYKKFKAGGIDNIVFGLMDVAAGFAYAVPGLGTAIGLGIDVLQYFLNNKAEEWKKETGETSFFGSMWDSIMGYLKETPMFKWFINTGRVMKEFWNNPTYDTFVAMGSQFGSILQPLIETFSMFNTDAGAALGLTDSEGNSQGLFTWIHDKVDEWIITPVMDFLGSIFESIGNGIMSLGANVHGFLKRVVDNNFEDGMVKSAIYTVMGFGESDGFMEEQEAAQAERAPKEAKLRSTDAKRLREWSIRYGGRFAEPEFLDSIDSMTDSQIQNMLQKVKQKTVQKEKRERERERKVPEFEELPKPDLDVEIQSPPMSNNVQNNVSQTQINTYVTPEAPSSRPVYVA